jgi:hypothetical protein
MWNFPASTIYPVGSKWQWQLLESLNEADQTKHLHFVPVFHSLCRLTIFQHWTKDGSANFAKPGGRDMDPPSVADSFYTKHTPYPASILRVAGNVRMEAMEVLGQ